MWTARTIAVVAIAGLAAAGATGAAVASSAGDSADPADLLERWVGEGSITQEDADAFDRVREQLMSEREERMADRQAQRQADLDELAAAAGVTTDDLVERLRDGETLAEIAGDNADAVADLLTRRAEQRLTEARDGVDERVEALMNGQGHRAHGGPGGFGEEFGGGFGGRHGGHGGGLGGGPDGDGGWLGGGPGGWLGGDDEPGQDAGTGAA